MRWDTLIDTLNNYFENRFLVICHATLHPAFSICPLVFPSDLKCGPCPPACDWGSRVSGLVLSNGTNQRFLGSILLNYNFLHLFLIFHIFAKKLQNYSPTACNYWSFLVMQSANATWENTQRLSMMAHLEVHDGTPRSPGRHTLKSKITYPKVHDGIP